MAEDRNELTAWAKRELNRFGVEDCDIERLWCLLEADGPEEPRFAPVLNPDHTFVSLIQALLHPIHHGKRADALKACLRSAESCRYRPQEWLEALAHFADRLERRSEVACLDIMNEYLECVAASPDARSGSHRLNPLLELHLDEFGFAAARAQSAQKKTPPS